MTLVRACGIMLFLLLSVSPTLAASNYFKGRTNEFTCTGCTTGTIPVTTGANALGDSPLTVSGGKVGIGIAPSFTLDVNSSSNGTDLRFGSSAGRGAISHFNNGLYFTGGAHLQTGGNWIADNTVAVTIGTLLGTGLPSQAAMEVEGASGLTVGNTFSPQRYFTINNNMNVGIGGLINPAQLLTIPYIGALAWDNGTDGVTDVTLFRDAAGILAQRNGTNAQTFRVYNTYTDASNGEWGGLDWQTNPNVLMIGTQNNGTGVARNVVMTGPKWYPATDNALYLGDSTHRFVSLNVGYVQLINGSQIQDSGNGIINLFDSSSSNFNRLSFGGTTASYPAIKRNATALNFRLADDSADAPITAGAITSSATIATGGYTVAGLPVAGIAGRRAYVTDQLTACPAFGGTFTGGGAVVCAAFDNGTSWISE